MKSKYFIAYLLTGPARVYHERLTRELASHYRIFPLHERSSPHITIKPPFEADEEEIAEVERVLRSVVHNESSMPLVLKGFGRLGFKTVYLDVYKSREATNFVRKVLQSLHDNLPGLPVFPHEGKKLHVSIARFMDRKRSRKVMRFLKEEKPYFELMFDSIAILKKDGRVWKVMTTLPLQQKEQPEWRLGAAPQEVFVPSR